MSAMTYKSVQLELVPERVQPFLREIAANQQLGIAMLSPQETDPNSGSSTATDSSTAAASFFGFAPAATSGSEHTTSVVSGTAAVG